MENSLLIKAGSRGHANHGWLDTYHYFSFASYYDAKRIHFGALRVINDDIVKGGYGFGKHPHDNMEIITIVLEGALEHKDSMGHTQTIKPNEVQVMSAGTGIFHSEYNSDAKEDVNLFQVWIFPEEHNVTPRYDQTYFEPAEREGRLQTVVSPMKESDGGLKINQQAWIYRCALKAGKSVEHSVHSKTNGLFILMAEGSATVNGISIARRDGLGLWEIDKASLKADTDAEIIVLEVPMMLPQ